MKTLLEVKNLKKYFTVEKIMVETKQTVKAVDDISFSLSSGQILAIVGESGSGKTTVARCIAGLETPDSGDILFNGNNIDFTDAQVRRKIQYIFQDTFSSLNPRMKIYDIIAEPLKFHLNPGKDDLKRKVIEQAARVGLSTNMFEKYPYELSGGQRQRVGIARALTMRPSVLIADEPVSSLDVSIQAQILRLFVDLNKGRGIGIIFITHDLRVVKNLADTVIVMNEGKIVESGKTEQIYKKPKQNYTKLLLSSIPNSPYKFKGI